MFFIFLIFSVVCAYNLSRRLTCAIKTKVTKFNLISLLVFAVFLFGVTYYIKGYYNYEGPTIYGYSAIICLAFFTSITSSGISPRGFIQPWNLISKIYTWNKIGKIQYEVKENSVMVTFATKFTEYRQEFEKNQLDEIIDFVYKNSKKKMKEI